MKAFSIPFFALPILLASPLLEDRPRGDADFKREGAGDERPSAKERREALDAMEGKTAPALALGEWLVGEPGGLEKFKGKVVLLDFWGNW